MVERCAGGDALPRRRDEQAIDLDRLKSLDVVVASITHEINNSIHSLMLSLPVVRDAWMDARPILDAAAAAQPNLRLANLPYAEMCEELPRVLGEMLHGADRIHALLGALLGYAGSAEPAGGTIDLNELLDDVAAMMGGAIRKSTSGFVVEHGDEPPLVTGARRRLAQLLIQLLVPFCAPIDGRRAAVVLRPRSVPGAAWVTIELERSIATELPVDYPGAVVEQIVATHGGRLEIDPAGAFARVLLPAYNRPVPPSEESP